MDYLEVISRKVAKARGLKVYFTGKPCKRGHVSERYVSGHCVECQRNNYSENKEAKCEYGRDYYSENKETRREYQREYTAKRNTELGCSPVTLWDRKKRAKDIGCSIHELPTRTTPDPARFVYVIELHGLHRPFAKVGITNDLDKRLRTHKRHLAEASLTYSVMKLVDLGTEDIARYEESCFKKTFEPSPIEVEGFISELFELNPFMRNVIASIKGIDLALAA